MKGYLIIVGNNGARSHIRTNRLEELREISGIVFDCDGVLIDIAAAYGRAVAETTSHIIEAFTGIKLPIDVIDQDVIFAFKMTGGFNNDWDLTYAITMYILSKMPEERLGELNEVAKDALRLKDSYPRFSFVKRNISSGASTLFPVLGHELKTYAESLDETGAKSVDKELLDSVGVSVKEALGYPGKVGQSIIPTLFEQLFCGPALFEETFHIKPRFEIPRNGFIEMGKSIITTETLKRLTAFLGAPKFGIASGSMANSARSVLGEILDDLDPEAQIWMEDIDRLSLEKRRDDLGKPNPFSLREATKALEPFKRILYVGDTMADLITVRRANEEDHRFLFAGVHRHSIQPEAVVGGFTREGADIITPSVNDLPHILEFVGGERD